MATPGTMEDFLRLRAKARKKILTTEPPFSCFEAFILTYGRSFERRPYPRNAERGEKNACFKNAWWLTLQTNGRLRYVEGFASLRNTIAVMHAWVIDDRDQVLDPTWRAKGGVYFGVEFDYGYLMRTAVRKRKRTSLISNLRDDFPLLTGKHSVADWRPKET